MTQFFTARRWLWAQWRSTIVRAVLPREVLANMGVATLLTLFLAGPGPHFAWRQSLIPRLAGVNTVWLLASSLVTFTISFFLSQAYSFWCSVLTTSRRVQGRLNDLSLLCAASAARHPDDNKYTPSAEQLLLVIGRYVRLFNILLYASVSTRFAPLRTPEGLEILVEHAALTPEERILLLSTDISHVAVASWLWAAVAQGMRDGRLPGAGARAVVRKGLPIDADALYNGTSERDGVVDEMIEGFEGGGRQRPLVADDSTEPVGIVEPTATAQGLWWLTKPAAATGESPTEIAIAMDVAEGSMVTNSDDKSNADDSGDSSGVGSGRDGGSEGGATSLELRYPAAPRQLDMRMERIFLELRATYASIKDILSGRMPLAYTQLVQILVDMLVIATPFALLPSLKTLGAAGVIVGTGVVTFFYSSVLNLAKVFLDPYDNESCMRLPHI